MKAMQVMSALSQTTRLDVFTKLIDALPDGVPSGDLAAETNMAPSAMSAHLAILARAGLVASERMGKTIVYRAVTAPVSDLLDELADMILRTD